jgi:TctA family transporter
MTSMMKANWDITVFFQRPIAGFLGCLTLAAWFSPLVVKMLKKRLAAPGT